MGIRGINIDKSFAFFPHQYIMDVIQVSIYGSTSFLNGHGCPIVRPNHHLYFQPRINGHLGGLQFGLYLFFSTVNNGHLTTPKLSCAHESESVGQPWSWARQGWFPKSPLRHLQSAGGCPGGWLVQDGLAWDEFSSLHVVSHPAAN